MRLILPPLRATTKSILRYAKLFISDNPLNFNVLQDIKLGAVIGAGAYGKVYNATLFGKPVAVKKVSVSVIRPFSRLTDNIF